MPTYETVSWIPDVPRCKECTGSGEQTQRGYDPGLFVDFQDKKIQTFDDGAQFICTICKFVMRNPVELDDCGCCFVTAAFDHL